MASTDRTIVRFSQGSGRNLGKAVNKTKSWEQLKGMFRVPMRTPERQKGYKKLPDSERKRLKSLAGWLYRTQIEGKSRNRSSGLPSDLVSMDFDYIDRTLFERLLAGKLIPNWAWFLHTTRGHTPENPRFRLYILLNEPVSNDVYGAVSRIMAREIDPAMENVDRVSFRPAQMMYMPTASKDQEYIFHENEGKPVNWGELLRQFELVEADWRVISNLPKVPDEHLRESAEKMEDPTQKEGIVGDFCRAFDIFEAMEEFNLPYVESDTSTTETPRFSYTKGGSVDGGIVYDGGLFFYSHHGTDPVSDMEVNAFDLVRMHKFADLDKEVDFDTPMQKRPSWKAMVELCQGNAKFKKEQLNSKYDMAAMAEDYADIDMEIEYADDDEDEDLVPEEGDEEEDDFADIELADEEGPKKKKTDKAKKGQRVILTDNGLDPEKTRRIKRLRPKPPEGWLTNLETTKDGNIISTSPNVAQIIANDNRTIRAIGFNELNQRTVIVDLLRTKLSYVAPYDVEDKINGDILSDFHTNAIRMIIESPNGKGNSGYGFKVSDRDMEAAIDSTARRFKFHPVRDFLDAQEDGGRELAETLWIKYLGTPDNAYYREASWKFLVGAVARIYEPGHKFDFVPILFGAQGKRKSTMIEILARDWFGELKAKFDDDAKLVEQMANCFIMEMPELSSIGRGRIEDVKAFISARETTVRLAWARRPMTFKRQCVFIGSTNEHNFLIDKTGNRRWWPVVVKVDYIDTDHLRANVNNIWGAAVAIYKEMRAAQPHGHLDLSLSVKANAYAEKIQEGVELETDVDNYAAKIASWVNKKFERSELEAMHTNRVATDLDDMDPDKATDMVHLDWTCIAEVREIALDQNDIARGSYSSSHIGQALRKLSWTTASDDDGSSRAEKTPPIRKSSSVLPDARASGPMG